MNRRDQPIEKKQSNPSLGDHGRVDIPAGPLSRQDPSRSNARSSSGSTVVKETIRPQSLKNDTVRSAVVKPKPKVLGDGSLRYDQPASPVPKIRQIAKLDQYVRFLGDRDGGEVVNELTEESLRIRAQILEEAAAKFEAELQASDSSIEQSDRDSELGASVVTSIDSEPQSGYRFSPLTASSDAMKDFYVQGITDRELNVKANSQGQKLPPEQAQQIWAEFEQAQRQSAKGVEKTQPTSKLPSVKAPPTVKRNPKPIVVLPSDVSQHRRSRTLVDIVVPGLKDAQEAAQKAAQKAAQPTSLAGNAPTIETNQLASSDDIPQKAFFVRKTTSGQTLSLPEVRQRYDHAHGHESHIKTPRAHVAFTQESQIENERRYRQSVAGEHLNDRERVQVRIDSKEKAKSELVAPHHPFSSVTYDEATANVIATISAAIASVIRDESEQELKEQADRLLRSVHEQAIESEATAATGNESTSPVAHEVDSSAEEIAINEDMLNDIVRQRFENFADADSVERLLNERIDSHQSITRQGHRRPEKVVDVSAPNSGGQPMTSITAFAAAQPSLSSAPAVVTATLANDWDSEATGATDSAVEGNPDEPGSVSVDEVQGIVAAIDSARMRSNQVPPEVSDVGSSAVEVIDEIPLELAAWDVEDFRWPVVSNQMIVTGGAAIEGLLSATLGLLPHRPRRIAVAGVGRVSGTTSLAISVSRWAAAAGHRTLLIDADVASPSLSGKLGVASNMSWLNGINHELPVSELVIRSRKTNLCVMPLASSVTRVTWPRFIFDNLGEVLESIRNRFDLIVIDAGPASQLLDELSSPSRLLDAVMLVNDVTESKKLETFKTRLETFGVERLIVADNRVPETSINVA